MMMMEERRMGKQYGSGETIIITECEDLIAERIKAVNDCVYQLAELAIQSMPFAEREELLQRVAEHQGRAKPPQLDGAQAPTDEAKEDGEEEEQREVEDMLPEGTTMVVHEGMPFTKLSEILNRLPGGKGVQQRRDALDGALFDLEMLLYGRHDIRSMEPQLRALFSTLDTYPELRERLDEALELVKARMLAHEIID